MLVKPGRNPCIIRLNGKPSTQPATHLAEVLPLDLATKSIWVKGECVGGMILPT